MRYTPPVRSSRGVQQAEVFAAADALLAEGKRPTIERVRLKIGRGSPNTVSPMLEHWFATLGSRMNGTGGTASAFAESGSPAAQDGMPEVVRNAAAALWEAAQREASVAARAAVAHDLTELEQREHGLASAQAALTQREEAFAATRASLDAALAAAQQASAALEQQLRGVAAEAHEGRRRLEAEIQRLNTRLAEANQTEQHVRQEAAAALVARESDLRQVEARHAGQERHWVAEVDRSRQQAKALEAEGVKAQERLRRSEEGAAARLEQERNKAEQLHQTHRQESDTLRAKVSELSAQLSRSGTDVALAGERCAGLQQRLDEERGAHEATRRLLSQALDHRSRGRAAPKASS